MYITNIQVQSLSLLRLYVERKEVYKKLTHPDK